MLADRRFNVNTMEQELPTEDIARRAYELWQARGCPPGDGSEDWQAAEAELAAGGRCRNGFARGGLWSWCCRLRQKITGRDM